MEDFICPICQESNDEQPLRIHPCGDHLYHLRCLVDRFRDDRRCVECGMRGFSGADPGVVPRATYQEATASSWECVLCMGNHMQNHSCFQINSCGHRLHVFCFNHLLMLYGTTRTGGFFCPRCNYYM